MENIFFTENINIDLKNFGKTQKIKGTLMQIWKSTYVFSFTSKWYAEGFAL